MIANGRASNFRLNRASLDSHYLRQAARMREMFMILLIAAIGLWRLPPALAFESSQIKFSSFHVQQKISHANGVWVSAPQSVDENIVVLLKAHHIQSLEDYSHWLERSLTYNTGSRGYDWQDPLKTLAQKQGDCKNFTILTATVLRVAGFEPRVVSLRRAGQGHMICAFLANGSYWWFDNAELKKTSAASFEAFTQEMVSQYDLSSFLEFDLQNQSWKTLYRKL